MLNPESLCLAVDSAILMLTISFFYFHPGAMEFILLQIQIV